MLAPDTPERGPYNAINRYFPPLPSPRPMRLLDLTLPTPALNLALDEALLLDADSDQTLRFWEASEPFVVLGRSSRHAEEVEVETCQRSGVPILRRVSGGATIVTGPGCLMYAVTLNLQQHPELADLGAAHRFVLGRIVGALQAIDPTAAVSGTSDLTALRDGVPRKFSGNSLRLVRGRLLYHGTLLDHYDLPLISRLLKTAPRQPDYRDHREHDDFVTNLAVGNDRLKSVIAAAWNAEAAELADSTRAMADRLVVEKYSLDSWNLSR